MLSSWIALAAFAATAVASPVAVPTCGAVNYGPFKLYAKAQGSNEATFVRVVKLAQDESGNDISTMTTCETCGDAPAHWELKDSVLTPVFFSAAEGQATVNTALTSGKVDFVTGDEGSLTRSQAFCAVRSTSTGNGLPGYLAVNGDAESFSVCSFIGTRGPAHRRDIYFKQTSNRIASNCTPVHLVMQSTGFVPEPIGGN